MYVTYVPINRVTPTTTFQQALEQLYNPGITKPKYNYSHNFLSTRTMHTEMSTTDERLDTIMRFVNQADEVARGCVCFIESCNNNINNEYETFSIPKHSGGLRHISAPSTDLREVQNKIVELLQSQGKMLAHNAAYGFVKGRCTKDALVTHQHSNARWFLKIDIKDFFPSCNKAFLKKQLKQLYPFAYLTEETIDPLLDVCVYQGGLPQGSTASPLLTNLMMVPIDYKLTKALFNLNKSTYTYTRYADDILISSPYSFKYTDILSVIKEVFESEDAPFTIHPDKTRYGSFNGRNWNLGLMYNNNGDITVGYKRKRRVKSMLFNFFKDNTQGIQWSRLDTQVLLGEVAYINNIEGEGKLNLANLESKYQVTLMQLAKPILNS